MVGLTLYGFDHSPPVRACRMTLEALNLTYDYKVLDVRKGEQFKAEFLKINPLHTVPVLVDGENTIFESHVICAYLVQKYGSKDDQFLYPRDLDERTKIDQRLYFDLGILFVRFKEVTVSISYF